MTTSATFALQSISPSVAAVAIRLAVAAALGILIGVEREFHGHEAGSRTHGLLALGAALFGAISVGAFDSYLAVRADNNVQIDVTRIASYVAAGIGFIAGGTIIKEAHRVRGLTTAASLWVTAAVGLAAGLGFYAGAIAGTVVALLTLFLDRPMKVLRRRSARFTVRVRLRSDADLRAVLDALHAFDLGETSLIVRDDDVTFTTIVVPRVQQALARTIVTEMTSRDDVVESFLYSD